jgi:hypothetical protein
VVLILEKNYHFDPLVQKLGRVKRKVMDMGELMDALTRYAESDSTKDPNPDDDQAGKGKKNGGGKGNQQNNSGNNGNHGNQGNGGKRKNPEGGLDFVANTNTGYKYQKGNNSGRPYGNKPKSFEEALKGPCPKHSLPNKPSTHSWENCHIMQAFGEQFF